MPSSDKPIAKYHTFTADRGSGEYRSKLREVCDFLTKLGPERVIGVTEDCDDKATYFNILYWDRARSSS